MMAPSPPPVEARQPYIAAPPARDRRLVMVGTGVATPVPAAFKPASGRELLIAPAKGPRAGLECRVVDDVRGAGIVRHEPRYEGFVAAAGQRQEVAEAIDRHVATYFGSVEFVLHEIASHLVGVHVYVIGPTAERPFQTLVTSGMSERPMSVPEGAGISPYAELMLCLPADWPLTQAALQDERTGWPVRVLKQVARFPHEYGTWIGEWHSVPNGDPAEPYAPGTPFAGVVVTPMLNVRPEARIIEVGDGTRIDLLALVPLHPAEVAVKVSQGTEALIAALNRGEVSELLDPARPSLV